MGEPKEDQPTIKVPQDKLLAELVLKHKDLIWKIHDHDSLLENQIDEHLTEEERKAAWEEYENEKKGVINMTNSANFNMNNSLLMDRVNPDMIRQMYRIQYPTLTDDQINQATRAYMMQIQSGLTGGKVGYDRSHYAQEMAKARNYQQQMYPGMYAAGRGSRSVEQVSSQDLNVQAQQLVALQRMAQIQRQNQQIQQIQRRQGQLQGHQGHRSVTLRHQPPVQKKPTETVTLDSDDNDDEISEVSPNGEVIEAEDDDDDDDDDDGEIQLDGTPEIEDVYDDYQPSTSSKRRGRPRIDPDSEM